MREHDASTFWYQAQAYAWYESEVEGICRQEPDMIFIATYDKITRCKDVSFISTEDNQYKEYTTLVGWLADYRDKTFLIIGDIDD